MTLLLVVMLYLSVILGVLSFILDGFRFVVVTFFPDNELLKEGEIITKLTFPRTKGSDMKNAINIDLGLEKYKSVPFASTLVSKVRFICENNTYYQIIENWFDQDKTLVGYSSVIDVEVQPGKDKLIPIQPDSILKAVSKLVCN
jgi:hypothetical protein